MKFILNILLSLLLYNSIAGSMDLKQYLIKNLKNYSKIDFKLISPRNIDLTMCKIDGSRDLKISRDLAYVPVIIQKNKENIHAFITLKLKLYKSVLVSNRSFKKHELLNPADFTIMEKEISDLRFEPIDDSLSVEHFRSKFVISENSILQSSMIERIPEIRIGDRIEAIFIKGTLNISFTVSARSEGIAGSIIRVRSDDNRIYKARVINNTTVKIIE